MNADFRPINRADHELLVVDDDPVSRYSTARLLKSAGFRVQEAANGAQALAAAKAGGVTAMVLDVHLPDINGFELCRMLRSHEGTKRVPVLHLSAAYVTDEDKVRGLDSGADAYLTHPVEPAVLVATVQALVRARVAEEEMRRSQEKFRAIYAHAPSGFALLNDAGAFVDANPAMLKLLGQSPEGIAGRSVADVFRALGADGRVTVEEVFSRVHEVVLAIRPDGSIVHLELEVTPRLESDLNLLVASDVSQRRSLEAQRQALLDSERIARVEAEKVSRMKDTLIAVLSHELRAPLNAIMGWTHVLQKRGTTEEGMRGLKAIERNGNIQARLIADLLDMSRLNLGKLPLTLEHIDPAEAVAAAVQEMHPTIKDSGVDVRLFIVPPYRPIRADPSRLQQVVWNLVSNAVKFSTAGSQVSVTVTDEQDFVLISVSDQGQGIAPEFLEAIFDRFTQSDAGSNRRRGGLGLGLSIVKQLVEAHGGAVEVRSAGLGQGATFRVRLPREAAVGAARPTMDSQWSGLDHHGDVDRSLLGLNLLVVDDDLEASSMLRIILADHGATVRTASGYEEALVIIEAFPIDVLVSDIGMPGKDGYDLIREVRRRESVATGRRLPAVALTAFAQQKDQQAALAAGFDAHCAKPLQPMRLVRSVCEIVGRETRP